MIDRILGLLSLPPMPLEKVLRSNETLKSSPLLDAKFVAKKTRNVDYPDAVEEFTQEFEIAQGQQKDFDWSYPPCLDAAHTTEFWGLPEGSWVTARVINNQRVPLCKYYHLCVIHALP